MRKLCSLILFIAPLTALAQEIELNPVTVSASLHELPAARTGRNIISIPGSQFEKLPVHSIDDLLRYLPGVEVQMRGAAGSQSDIAIRGGTFQQVLIILDGIRLNDPNTGHFNGYIPIAPSEIEKIEVLKGASSAIYGSEAVGGVVHIITKSFAAKRKQSAGQASVTAMGGAYEFWSVSAGAFHQKNNTALALGILSNNSNGQMQRGTRGYFHNHTVSASWKQFINEHWDFSFRTAIDRRDFSAQNFYTTFASDTANEQVNSNWNHARLRYSRSRHQLSLDAGYKTAKDIFQFNPSSIANNNRSKLLQLLLTDHFNVNNNTFISAGFQYQNRCIRSNDRGNHSLNQVAGFVILNQKFNDITLSPSLRVDHSQRRGTELVPQLNLSWNKGRWQFRASAGKTIRDADFTERFNNYNKEFVAGGSVGYPDLVAERSFSYEAGADYFSANNLRISFTAFERRQQELIDWITTPYSEMPRQDNLSPTGTYALAKNIAEVNTRGIETDLQFVKVLKEGGRVYTSLGLVWMESVGDNAVHSFYISSHARFLANLAVEYQNGPFTISATAIYKNRKPQKADAIHAEVDENSFLLNTRFSVLLCKRLSVFAEVDNLLDNKTSDLLGSQLPGRWTMGGVNFRIF